MKNMISEKPKLLVIKAGGTIGMEEKENGSLAPSNKDYLKEITELNKIADYDVIDAWNLDSTEMNTEHRKKIAKEIYSNYEKYTGFIIIQGTDTLVDSAAALNYMIRDTGKPIVLTGSQIPFFSDNPGDARSNLYLSFLAAIQDVGEVIICFGNYILRGCRTIKISEWEFKAFESPNIEPIGELGLKLKLYSHRKRRRNSIPELFTDFDTKVEFFNQPSGADSNFIEYCTKSEDVHGLVIGGYGAGNIESKYAKYLPELVNKGKPVVVITTCYRGKVEMDLYEVGNKAKNAGAISGYDLTSHAAIQKLMWSLGKAKKHNKSNLVREVKKYIHTSIGDDISIDH